MHQRKILLLENVATPAAAVREKLAQAGFHVVVSRYETDGLKRLAEWGPELVLLSTAHPAGDLVEYCRRARALAPAARFVITAPLGRERLFQEHPGLQELVVGVLPRTYRREDVVALLAPAAAAASPEPAAEAAGGESVAAEVLAESQRQLDALFLEVEEPERHREAATGRAAPTPGLEWLQFESDHLREGVEEERSGPVRARANERLKDGEIEVKLDDLPRLNEDAAVHAGNGVDDRTRAVEPILPAAASVGALAAAPPETTRVAALEAELSRQRALAAEGQLALAELTVKSALLEESLARAHEAEAALVAAHAAREERRAPSPLQSAPDRGVSPSLERATPPAGARPEPGPRTTRRWFVLGGVAAVTLALVLAAVGVRRAAPPSVSEQQPASRPPQPAAETGTVPAPREVWERWTRNDTSGGVLVQATLRSEEELRAEVEADRAPGISDEELRLALARRLGAFQFDTTFYVSVYLKNLDPGYPAYLDDLVPRFRLRDSSGKEVPAFLPPGHEQERRVFSFGSGAPGDLIYEATVPLGFDRAGLSPSARYLQLVVADVGAASRRVLTWELE